ncbi:hypothetical protein IF125_11575 [Empedobacter stercoris]|uniref:hypothetical protein n=1 Tax=Empedobacter stercoris TaxID=1628248 RepID=UPI001CE12BC4|nr:hypothetical protein [Empedobacter stercoris]MCA4782885.1 hypothetical protein [Empedobacter stercoris]
MNVAEKKESYSPLNELKRSYDLSRISEYPINDAKTIIEASVYQDATLKGIKDENLPGEFVLDDISEMILKMFWMLTPEEIVSALKMDRFGYFEEKSQHYQFYGTEYVAEILKKYCKWKHKKAMEHNLSRKPASHQIEYNIDEKKIDEEYRETILSEIREGKSYRYINAHLLIKSVPNRFKPNKKQYYSLLEKEEMKLKNEKELKLAEEKDPLSAKKIIREFNETLKVKAHQRVCNIIVCNWLNKTIIQNGT